MSNLKIDCDKLEKYLKDKKKEYEHDLFGLSEEFESSKLYIKGHIRMIDMLLDDIDSFLAYDVLGVDLTNSNDSVRECGHQSKTGSNTVKEPVQLQYKCNRDCEYCAIAEGMKHKFLEECDSIFDAVSEYADFINSCGKVNGVKL